MNLERALSDIAAMRVQVARTTQFRGYGPVTLAMTGCIALAAGMLQHFVLPSPTAHIGGYLSIWISAAIASVSAVALECITRSRRVHSDLADQMILLALQHFLPAGVAGVLLTVVIAQFAPTSVWMLPGLWQIVLSLGVFATAHTVPRPLVLVGVWYLTCGLFCLVLAQGARGLSPLAMAVPFASGQFLAAALLQYVEGRYDEI